MDEWKSVTQILGTNIAIENVLLIIDDCLCMGFEFKVENHDIFTREVNH